jgi:quercetin dioxygenase-like cupin family protein
MTIHRRSLVALLLSLVIALGCGMQALAQEKPNQRREPTGVVKYESVAEGVHEAQIFRTDALRDVRLEVKDLIFGPGKSASDISVQGFAVTELRSGEVDTTIDGQTMRRKPGDFWVVRPGQKYSIKNLGGMVVLHATIFTRK